MFGVGQQDNECVVIVCQVVGVGSVKVAGRKQLIDLDLCFQ